MSQSSDLEEEQSEISESEITDCVEIFYSQLQSKHYVVKKSGAFKCPFCPAKKKQRYQYKDLLQHASSTGTSNNRPKIKAQHQALAKYMKHDLVDHKLVHQVVATNPVPPQRKDDEKYVWPWKGILVNLPVKYQGGQYLGKTANEIKEMISNFNPSEVFPLWDCKGHTGRCIVDFRADWDGFHNAMSFNKHFQSRGVGRLKWQEREHKSKEVHGWIAIEIDFNRSGMVADHLRQHGVLKSVDDVMRGESSKARSRVANLTVQIEAKNQDIYEMECKYNMSALSLTQAMEDREGLTQAYNEELRMLEEAFCSHHQSVLEQNERMRTELEYKRRQLNQRSRQLTYESSQYEINKQELDNKRQNRAEIEQQKANEEVLMLTEQQKRDKEVNLKRILQLQKELDAKQQLELEIEKLKGQIEVRRHMGGGNDDSAVKEKMESLKEELQDKIDEMEVIEAVNKGLLEKESQAKDEVKEARMELIKQMENILGPRTTITLKRMGELKAEVFKKSAPPGEDADRWAITACSKWQDELKNPKWCPFKEDGPRGEEKIIIKDDEKLVEVRSIYGEEVYEAVKTALLELNEYNPNGRYAGNEIWKAKENRKATLKEVIQYIFKQWKTLKAKRRCP